MQNIFLYMMVAYYLVSKGFKIYRYTMNVCYRDKYTLIRNLALQKYTILLEDTNLSISNILQQQQRYHHDDK